jgi:hypothetical protein
MNYDPNNPQHVAYMRQQQAQAQQQQYRQVQVPAPGYGGVYGDGAQTVQTVQQQGGNMQPAAFPPGTQNPTSLLSPPGFSNYAQAPNVQWHRIPAHLPQIAIPSADFITTKAFDNAISFTGNASGAAYTTTLQFPEPSVIFALTATAIDTTGAALTRDPRDCFTLALVRTNADKLQSQAVLGSTICGTAERPRYVGPNGWVQDRGSSIQITLTPLFADLRVDLVCYTAVIYGPSSFTLAAG